MTTIPATMDELRAWLAEFPLVDRTRFLGLVMNGPNLVELGAMRQAWVWELTREEGATHASVAEELDVAATSVTKAVTKHRKMLNMAAIKAAGVSLEEATAGVDQLRAVPDDE